MKFRKVTFGRWRKSVLVAATKMKFSKIAFGRWRECILVAATKMKSWKIAFGRWWKLRLAAPIIIKNSKMWTYRNSKFISFQSSFRYFRQLCYSIAGAIPLTPFCVCHKRMCPGFRHKRNASIFLSTHIWRLIDNRKIIDILIAI